jgi:ribosomal-protein-alanine N-acetyltransferase
MSAKRHETVPSADADTVRVRPARAADVPAVSAIEQRAFSDPWSGSSFDALLGNPVVLFAVAEDASGNVIGYVVSWYAADEAEIANLAVSPDARRRGIGARLLAAATTEARRRACRTMFLEVRQSNVGARALYEARGFVQVGRRPRYYREPVEDALVLRRVL